MAIICKHVQIAFTYKCQKEKIRRQNRLHKSFNKRSKTTNVSSLQVDDKILTKSDEIAESMNQYFCNISQSLGVKIPLADSPLLRGDFILEQIFN